MTVIAAEVTTSEPTSSGGSVHNTATTATEKNNDSTEPAALFTPIQKEPPRRVRTSRPKVKTGCSNCKKRRIKCDEKRPECTQCVRSKRQCVGYPPPARSARPHEVVPLAPRPISMTPSLTLAPMPIATTGTGPNLASASKLSSASPLTTLVRRPATPMASASPHIHAISVSSGGLPFSVIRQLRELPPRNRRSQKVKARMAPEILVSIPPPPMFWPVPRILRFNPGEEQYYVIFQARTSGELSGYFDCVFWTRTILRECEVSATIKHAVLALGALYKTLEQSSRSPPGSPSLHGSTPGASEASSHWNAAVRLYSEAITSQTYDPSGPITPRVRLMLSVLLASFDSFVGHHEQAIQQIQVGLGFLHQLRAEQAQGRTENTVEGELLQMFTRLAIQAKSYDMAFHFPEPYVVRLLQSGAPLGPPTEFAIPERFMSALQARLVYDNMLETIFRFTETFFTLQKSVGPTPMGLLSANILQLGQTWKMHLDHWGKAYEGILRSRFNQGVSWQEKASIAVLKMTHAMTTVLFLMTFVKHETAFDQYEPVFEMIVNLASEVVGDEERRAATSCSNPAFCMHKRAAHSGHLVPCHIKPSFSADLGIVPPLYVVATKCREPQIRRRAIDLLQSSARREGMWDSQLSARIAETITNLEESRAGIGMQNGNGIGGEFGRVQEVVDGWSPEQLDIAMFPTMMPGQQGVPVPHHNMPATIPQKMTVTLPLSLPPQIPVTVPIPVSMPVSSSIYPTTTPPPPTIHPTTLMIPETHRLMVQSVKFDLRCRQAELELGTRGKLPGTQDDKMCRLQLNW